MDVDVVESVGKQLTSQSQSVTSLIKTVDRLVASADAHWYGTRGREFVNAWRNVHRPALVAAASAVEGLGRSALQNASAQRRVSATASLATSHAASAPGVGSLPGAGSSGAPWLSSFDGLEADGLLQGMIGVAGVAANLGKNEALVGRYSSQYLGWVNRFGGGGTLDGFWRYKHSLNGPFGVNGLGDVLHNSKTFGAASKLSAGYSLVTEGFTAMDSTKSPTERGLAMWKGAMTVVKQSKNPVVYLSGVAGSSVGLAVEAGSHTDWSAEGFRMAVDEVKRNPGVIAEEFGKSAKQMFTKDIWEIF